MALTSTNIGRIGEIRAKQESYFRSGATLDVRTRKANLVAFEKAVLKWEKPLCEALWKDLHKSYEESYIAEVSILLGEIRTHIRNVGKWTRPQRRPTPMKLFPSRSKIISEPLGTALIISPWNYPVQLLLTPLVGVISSGCTAVLKPSPYVPEVSDVIEKMIRDTFPEEYVAVVQGDRDVNTALLEQRWDMIFFTGSPSFGRAVMTAAAKNLTPVVLELGGKSPCIIDKDADIEVAAKRVAWGKSLNAGQTCIAPDYLMLHKNIKDKFLSELEKAFGELLGDDPQKSEHFVRIVNYAAFERLKGYLADGEVVFGGKTDKSERYFSPTVLDHVSPDSPVMQEEIFGPIFPVQTFSSLDEVIMFVSMREKPLALYYFGSQGDKILKHTTSGGSCINDVIMHIANENVPFGGVGMSGMGSYHHKRTFDVFTHYRSVISTPTWIDLPFRYMPYMWFNAVKRLL
ncbi:MAG: aldehyde dehydrogenase family protein [Candidatus Cryptobacteroides sp.]|nr:aldehyde dehydrogenase family protein [Candidatus Cryptobacteroides sp.]